MLTRTSEMAVQTLVCLALRGGSRPVAPADLAARLGISGTYIAKVTGQLTKAGILRGQRGLGGGVSLGAAPASITLLAVVEACQGKVLGKYCDGKTEPVRVCAYHRAMLELHDGIVSTLGHWTLADLLDAPGPDVPARRLPHCRMRCAAGCAEKGGKPIPARLRRGSAPDEVSRRKRGAR